jgi:hypothetical protein
MVRIWEISVRYQSQPSVVEKEFEPVFKIIKNPLITLDIPLQDISQRILR